MKAIITNPINTPEAAKQTAADLVKQAEISSQNIANTKARRAERAGIAIQDLLDFNPELGGFEAFGSFMQLPDEHFALLAPVFLGEFERKMGDVNNLLAISQELKITGGFSAEEYFSLCDEIDRLPEEDFSQVKKDFLKQFFGFIYNVLGKAQGAADYSIFIPIEYCREGAKMPTYAHLTDAGMDVYLTEDVTIHPGETKLIPTGIKVAIPLGYELQVRPKSGRSLKSKLRIANTPGTIDAGYRDEICIIADNIDPVIRYADMDETGRLTNILWGSDITLSKGEKIAQLVLSEVPKAVFYEVESVAAIENDGRKGGFGSTGNK